MKVLVTGGAGYIGGSIAAKLRGRGDQVLALVRPGAAGRVRELGLEPVVGSLDDAPALGELARQADAVIHTADADHRGSAEALVAALEGTGKPLVHTSGSSIVAEDSRGEPTDKIYDESALPEPVPEKKARVGIDRLVLDAAGRGVRSAVIVPTLIYGRGRGAKRDSAQVPALIREAKRAGAGRHIGRGENVWSHVYIDDLVDLYLLVLDKAPPGALYFAEQGEASMRAAAAAVGRMLGYGGETEAWPLEEAEASLGAEAARFALGSNSRVRALRARGELGWRPSGPGLLDEIERGSYREDFGRA